MTRLVGILNLTPDSFSGDGIHAFPQKAPERMDALIADGADVVDIGAESTRPGAALLSPQEEWQRFEPVIGAIAARMENTAFSFDTRHVETAARILERINTCHTLPLPKGEGFAPELFINDVGGRPDEAMVELTHVYGATLIVMHALGVPANPAITIPEHEDAVEVVYRWAGETLEKYGDNTVIDPGIGFGKTAAQSLALVKNIARIQSLGAEVMVGHSRKSFLARFTGKKAADRDTETLVVSEYLARRKVDYLRVHDVKSHAVMIRIMQELG
jgi:dihydropteroate synthase